MNRSLQDIGGGLLRVLQFTLAADTRKGMRPSLTPAADPGAGERVRLSRRARTGAPPVDFSRRARRFVPRRDRVGRAARGDLGNVGVLLGFEIRGAQSAGRRIDGRPTAPLSSPAGKHERDAAVIHRLARDAPESSLEAAKETDRGVTRSTHPLETVEAIAEPPVGVQNGPKPVNRKHGGLRPIETETIRKGRSRARLDNDFVCPPYMVGLRGQRDRGQD
jgi:hypothetical protein